MKETIAGFFDKMITFFPQKRDEYNQKREDFFEGLDTIIIEEVFMPEILKLLKENRDIELLKSIFDYFEKVSGNADEELLNIFSITTLEILGNDKEVLEIAKKYMGTRTEILQREADRALGRDV